MSGNVDPRPTSEESFHVLEKGVQVSGCNEDGHLVVVKQETESKKGSCGHSDMLQLLVDRNPPPVARHAEPALVPLTSKR